MIYIKLVERHLIYGFAFIWRAAQFVSPQPWWPDLNSINNVYLLSIPLMKSYYKIHLLFSGLGNHKLLKNLLWGIHYTCIVSVYLVYFIEVLAASVKGYKEFLASYGILETDTLSFKFVYYTYFLWKVSILVVLIYSVTDFNWLDKAWQAHRKYCIFSVDFEVQLRIACIAFFIGFFDGGVEHIQIVSYLEYVPQDQYIILRFLHCIYVPNPNLSILVKVAIYLSACLAGCINLLAQCIKYRPLSYALYSAQCIAFHLHSINSQLIELEEDEKEEHERKLDIWTSDDYSIPDKFSTRSKYTGLNSKLVRTSNKIHSVEEFMNMGPVEPHRKSSIIMVDMRSKLARVKEQHLTNSINDNKSTSFKSSTSFSPTSSSSSSLPVSLIGKSRVDLINSRAISSESGSESKEQQQRHKHHHYLETISSLRQLELHLSQLNLFIYDVDTGLSLVLFAFCMLCLMQFISSAFLVVEVWRSGSMRFVGGILLTITPLSVPFLLFYSGNQMELEAAKMSAHLDRIYLQDPTQCLIYKQYQSTMDSLKRVTDLLKGVKFNCANLMDINLGTMKMFILYTLTLVFFVIQYDSLNILYDKSKAPTEGSSSWPFALWGLYKKG